MARIPAFSFSFVEYVARKANEAGWRAELLDNDYILIVEEDRVPVLTIDGAYRNGLSTHELFRKQYTMRSEASVKRSLRRLVAKEKARLAYESSIIDILLLETYAQ